MSEWIISVLFIIVIYLLIVAFCALIRTYREPNRAPLGSTWTPRSAVGRWWKRMISDPTDNKN